MFGRVIDGLGEESAPKGNRTPVSTLKEWCPNRWTMRAGARREESSGNGIRTRVSALRGLCPSPLDDTAGIAFRPRDIPTTHHWGHNIARRVEKDNGSRWGRGGRSPNFDVVTMVVIPN